MGKLRQIVRQPELDSLAAYEDPAENQFAEEFTFFGGSFLVFPGIAQAGEFMLASLCKAVFLSPNQALPHSFRSRALRIVSSALHLTHAVAKKAEIRRGTAPNSSRYSEIVIPTSSTLIKLKNAVTFESPELDAVLAGANLAVDDLAPLVSDANPIDLNDYDLVDGPLLWKPFVRSGEKIILAIPGMVVSAIRQALIKLAYRLQLQGPLAHLYNRAVWENVVRSLGFTGNVPSAHRPFGPLRLPCAVDGIFSLDCDKVLYCLLLTDPLTRAADSAPFSPWTEGALENAINERISEVEKAIFSSKPAPDDLFIVVVFQGLGGAASFGLENTPAKSLTTALSAEALRTFSLLEGGNPLSLFNFARSRDQATSRTRIKSSNIMDEFYLYRKSDYSYYFFDKTPPDFVVIPPGDSVNLQSELARHRDFHGCETPEGAMVEVTALHSTTAIPIYTPVAELGETARLAVEGFRTPVWITASEVTTDAERHHWYAMINGAIAYWIWQLTPFLVHSLNDLTIQRPIEITVTLPHENAWRYPSQSSLDPQKPPVQLTTDASQNLMELTVNAELFGLLRRSDNLGERELMRHILSGFSPLVGTNQRLNFSASAVDKSLDDFAPPGLKKMLLLFDSSVTPEIDRRGIPAYRPLQRVWINRHLDRIGERLFKQGLSVGDVDPTERTSLLNEVAAYCFSQVQRIVSSLSQEGLLEFVVAHSETVHQEHAMNRLTIPTRLECFRSDPEIVEELKKKTTELANVGLASRMLVEYVAAQPPKGIRPLSLDLYDEVRAWAYHCVNYAMLSDAIYFGIEKYKLTLLPSHRLAIDGSTHQSAALGHMRAFVLDQIGSAHENLKRQWQYAPDTRQTDGLREGLDAATAEEFGVPISQLLALMEFGISLGQKLTDDRTSLPESQFIQEAATALQRDEASTAAALELLSLGPRTSFWSPPPGFTRADLYPWRYDRPLSYLRRPFLRTFHEGAAQVAWGYRHLRAAQRSLVDQCTSGKIKAKTKKMRSFMNGLLDAQGEAFNKKVSSFFETYQALKIKHRVKKVGRLRELQDHLGDIDVLVGDEERKRILVIECKDLSASRTPYEMATEFTDLFLGSDRRKSVIDKHKARVAWVKSNTNSVTRFLGINPTCQWKILPLIIVDQPLLASYVRTPPIQVLSFEELKEFWPDIRRA